MIGQIKYGRARIALESLKSTYFDSKQCELLKLSYQLGAIAKLKSMATKLKIGKLESELKEIIEKADSQESPSDKLCAQAEVAIEVLAMMKTSHYSPIACLAQYQIETYQKVKETLEED